MALSLRSRVAMLMASRPKVPSDEERFAADCSLFWDFAYGIGGAEAPSPEFLAWWEVGMSPPVVRAEWGIKTYALTPERPDYPQD